MKQLILTACFLLIASFAVAQEKFEVGKPGDANYTYLKNYKALKTYVDRTKYPNFRVGLALGAADYNQSDGIVRKVANANVDEVVTGNAMKMGSCVSGNGSMNFSTVKTFVNNASAAGLNIYGHTLAWHAQQPRGWLLSLMNDHPAKPIEGADIEAYQVFHKKDFRKQQNIGWHANYDENNYEVSFDATDGMKVTVTKKAPQNYYVQYIAASDVPTVKGEKYKMIMTVKGSAAGYIYARLGDWGGGPNTNLKFTTEWQDVEWSFTNTISNPFLLLQHGDFVGDIWIKNIRFEKIVMGKNVSENRRCLVFDVPAKKSSDEGYLFYIRPGQFKSGDTFKFSAQIRADKRANISSQTISGDDGPIGTLAFSNTWNTVTAEGKFDSDGTFVIFNLAELEEDNKYYIDNVSLQINGEEKIINGDFEGEGTSSFAVKVGTARAVAPSITQDIAYLLLPSPTPQTAEEKHDTLVYAMDKWIKGMMEACNGKVRAWDLVNEAISGGDSDGDGIFDLQHDWALTDEDGFFWQDFMGDLEYVRQACRLARKYGPDDIKLFINDYNLESDWDNNGKLKSLIKWIERWEADGVTKIDGIGSQMHISCSMNPGTLASRRKHIRQMFELMAATGKFVRVSELDMGMDDANGNGVQTANMTEEMHKMMADHYEYILKTYFEVVPPEQQWGICQWCATDSPANSGWRKNTPVGLWDLNWYRKHTYAGWVRGLAGGEPVTAIEGVETDGQTIFEDSNAPMFNLAGQRVGADYRGVVIKNGKKTIIR